MLDKNTAFSLLRPDHEKMYFSHCWTVSKTPPPAVSHFTRWETMRHLEAGGVLPARTPWDTQGWSPRTLPDLPHFNTSLTNEPMDFCRSIWWICAGGSPDFLTDCSPELVRQIAFMKFSPKPISGCLDIWSLVFTWSIQGMPLFRSKISARVIFVATAGTFKSLWWLWPFLTGGNQFPIMNTLSSDGSERRARFEKLPQFSAVFSICRLNWGRIAHLEPD